MMPILDSVEAALEQHEQDAITAALAPVQEQLAAEQSKSAGLASSLEQAQGDTAAAQAQVATEAAQIADLQAKLAAVPPPAPALTVPRPTLMQGDIDLPPGEYHNVVFTGLVKWLGPSLLEDCSWDLQPLASRNFGTYANLLQPKTLALAAAGGLVGRRWKMNGHGLSAFLNAVSGSGYDLDTVEMFGTVDGFHGDMAGTSKIANLVTHDGSHFSGGVDVTGHPDGTHGDAVQLLVGHLDVSGAKLGGYSNAGLMLGAAVAGKRISGTFSGIEIVDGVPQSGINLANVNGLDDLSGITIADAVFAPTKHYSVITYGAVNAKVGRLVDSAGNTVTVKKMS
jgi:hypothetical protein